ncbi:MULTISPECIES: type II toxin-antitoxin system VapB family antitoxin [Amycolatopsis]|uniref:Type II toxin-antitoxin system VapB family antitoxin n=1 Tax=Amycolatopsis dendrobii TaxID=2760662 RepID=A0A7W3W465_9PSEU|nr:MULTISPECIES: type II toxin-antitoxin system VapB family antitoxin [Amycolatopsis]MBB1158526.1 type II toxin-antitoxin system VapB family antitoxin [Amycolatopsis dendrobii]UKD58507.1 type II toxin-antitoxin system VapB family antitoxin [Amycolatopsis sp. FU40]
MALNIKDPETERLAAEVAELTGTTKTGAVRDSLRIMRDRLLAQRSAEQNADDFVRFLQDEIWPQVSAENRGKPVSKAEREEILGYGPGGV